MRPCSSSAAAIAPLVASSTSPSTMIVMRPYRSTMCPGCHGVAPWRSARIRHEQLADARERRRWPRRPSRPTGGRAIHSSCSTAMPTAYVRHVVRRSGWPRAARSQNTTIATRMIAYPSTDDVVVALVERPWHPRREHEHPGHLHEGQGPEEHVVGVVRRGEPGEVHPRPPDRPEDHEVAAQVAPVRLGEPVVQVRRRRGDGDDEREVEEQLERGRRAVLFGAVAPLSGTAHGVSLPVAMVRGYAVRSGSGERRLRHGFPGSLAGVTDR